MEMQRATKARQTFLMIAVVDFLCTLIMWLLVVVSDFTQSYAPERRLQVLSGKELVKDFSEQVDFSDPNFFKHSLFDLVVCLFVTRCFRTSHFSWPRLCALYFSSSSMAHASAAATGRSL